VVFGPSGSVAAADGSTISWSTAADGTLTATGSSGAQLVKKTSTGKTSMSVQTQYSEAGQKYLSVGYTIDLARRRLTTTYRGTDMTIWIVMGIYGDDPTGSQPATVSGVVHGNTIRWRGALTPGATDQLAQVPGWPAGELAPLVAKSSYFAPLIKLIGDSSKPVQPQEMHDEPWWKVALGMVGLAVRQAAPAGQAGVYGGLFLFDAWIVYHDIGLLVNGLPDSETMSPPKFTPDLPTPSDALDGGVPMGVDDAPDGGGCFVAGTVVRLTRGEVPIEQIVVGDEIVAFDTDRQVSVPRFVEQRFEVTREEVVVLDFDGDTIRCTPPHRFYTRERGWCAARKLVVGDAVLGHDGAWRTLRSVSGETGSRPVFNVSVAETHTYLVGRSGLVVHNVKKVDGDDDPDHDRGDDEETDDDE
jgi:hypothetical protein